MKKLILLLLTVGLLTSFNSMAKTVKVKMETNRGDIILELDSEKAPLSVANFLNYAESGFYEKTIFHRVISNFMIQGGGFTEELERKETKEPIQNEATNGLKNNRGTIAMARLPDPHSATAQFFINVKDNPALNHTGEQNGRTWGYAVFGKVIEGMDVVDEIRYTQTGPNPPLRSDVPIKTMRIEKVSVMKSEGTDDQKAASSE